MISMVFTWCVIDVKCFPRYTLYRDINITVSFCVGKLPKNVHLVTSSCQYSGIFFISSSFNVFKREISFLSTS